MSQVVTMSLRDEESLEISENCLPESDPLQGKEALGHGSSEEALADGGGEEVHAHSDNEETRKEKGQKHHFAAFLEELSKLSDNDSKLQCVMGFMESTLAQHGSPHFKSFWDARNVCLDLFKENISPVVRAEMWAKYTALSKEARRLKEILDEQSAFAAEQIEIAIHALIQDIEKNGGELPPSSEALLLPVCKMLEGKASFYELAQRELNVLNTQASRINALRKELIRTEMRVRQKNKFFQQLSAAGDKVFPRRKELIKDISSRFMEDVDSFVSAHFTHASYQDSLFFLREEIKVLQGIAKLLTLNTHSFTQTRMKLSECWDKIKGAEKEKKKERAQQKEVHRQNAQAIQAKIEEFQSSFAEGQMTTSAANEKIDEIFLLMKSTDLGRDEIRWLREEIGSAKKPLLEKIKAEEEARQAMDLERERQKKEKIENLKQEIGSLIRSADNMDVEEITDRREALVREIAAGAISKYEKLELERQLKPLRDLIADKKEKALLNLSDNDRQALEQLNELLRQRKERRQEVKAQIEGYRKASGSSGWDIEKALAFNAQLSEENERLEKLNEGIREIEKKIAELEK